ncbi:ribonuclease HI family protein [Propionivibrio sp.]|uniref:ribonuclease HI family protein n=1 Tax=Propionivibrio sp. TaxID=2212460 RepID=UPI003BEFDAC9
MTDEQTGWTAWFDGAANPNPGSRGIGGLLKGPRGERIEISSAIGSGTSNEAEYAALIAVLDAACEAGIQELTVYGDSQLVIKQVNGEWLINSKSLVPMCQTVLALMADIPNVIIRWIPRAENGEADALSKKAIGGDAEGPVDRKIWTTPTEIGKAYRLSGIAMGKRMDSAKLRAGGKPTQLAIDTHCALVVANHFGHDVFWHRTNLPAALKAAQLLWG